MPKKNWAPGMMSLCALLFVLPAFTWLSIATTPGGAEALTVLATPLVIGLGMVILALVLAGPDVIGQDRDRMSRLFGLWARSVLVLLALDVLAQAVLFAYVSMHLRQLGDRGAPPLLLLAVLAVGCIGFGVLLRAALSSFRANPIGHRAVEVLREQHPRLFALVDSIAQKVGIEPPQHIVVGLEPTFFVTNQSLRVFKQDAPLTGQTMYLSLSMMRVLEADQVAAIIGHELGHFKGQDLLYSTRFAPTYKRFSQALLDLAVPTRYAVVDFLKLPLVRGLEACFLTFAASVHAVGRHRELEADRVAADATSPRTVASALVQTSLWAPAWEPVMQSSVQFLGQGACFENLSQAFESVCRYESPGIDAAEVGKTLMSAVQAHPVDTHPSLGQRLGALGVRIDEVLISEVAANTATSLLEGAEQIERELTQGEVLWLCARTGTDPATITKAVTRRLSEDHVAA